MRDRESSRERMRELLGRWQRSGESAAAFSRRHGMNPQKMSYWKRVLGLSRPAGAPTEAGFVPVRVVGAHEGPAPGALEIVVGVECRVVVREGVSRELLREVLALLREGC